ncbi:LemA family protein [bacterium]|nr:LemA family protein [bacterium]
MGNIIFVSIGIGIVLIFFWSISIIHMRTIRDEINTRWYNLADKLQYRQDLIPNLIETIRLHTPEDKKVEYEKLIQKTIQTRSISEKTPNPGSEKIIIEHDLSDCVNKLLDLAIGNSQLAEDTNFLELKKQLKDIWKELNNMSDEYNNRVRSHNRLIRKIYNLIPALLMRYSKKKIFEFE